MNMEYHKKIILSGMVILSIILVSSFDEFIFAQENSWEILNSMDISRSDYTGVVVDTKIYLIQGIGAEDNFTFFDTSTGLFTELIPAPYYAHHSASAIHDGKIYLAGGCNFGHPCPTAAVYDISSNKWSSLPAMPPVPTWAAAAEIVKDEFFVMGGSPNEKTCQKYSIANNSWSICADLPTGREHLSSAVYENKIYVINGRGGGPGDLTANEVYDPITDTWEILADKPTGMAGGSAGTFKNKIFVIGGEGPLTGANEWYDPATDSWTSGPDMPTPRHGLVCEPSGSKIYCFGGGAVEGGGKSAIVEVFDTNSIFETLDPEPLTDSPSLEIIVKPNPPQIPDWIKQNAKWWADGKIDDSTFLQGIQYMINNKIISIPDLPESAESSDDSIPAWIKNNARWWADGKIREDDFVNGIKYLVGNGIIQVSISDSIDVNLDESFELSIGQTANIESENLSVTLLDVYNDSRCPVDVTCVWQGEATALMEITDFDNEVSEMELQWLSKTTFDFDGFKYEIHFENLKPDNYTTKDVSDQPYKATFTIWYQN